VIFHLKRFDFDMVNMLRSKINDEFQFPHHIDMTPYTVEHLSDPEQTIAPDIFELVGILVHTGTAESGHYYSYTLERPSSGDEPSWVEFNDSDVTKFDPAAMADQCFGGSVETMHYIKGDHKIKTWNAYMLFYQRVSTIEKSKEVFKPTKPGIPVHPPVSPITQNHIAMDNELLVRIYCLLDPQYSLFVAKLLQRWPSMAPENANRTRAESLAVHIGMETMEQLVPRIKENQGLQEIYSELVDMILKSPNAALSTLEWLTIRQSSMYNIMLRTFKGEIRSKELTLINTALDVLHSSSTEPDLNEEHRASWGDRFDEAIQRLVPMLTAMWPELQCLPRVWQDYFKFILGLCDYGTSVVQILLDQGYLAICLEVIWIDEEDSKMLRNRHPGYTRLRSKGRQFNYQPLLLLCLEFFRYIDLSLRPTPIDGERQIVNGKFSTNINEMNLIKQLEDDGSLSIVLKFLKHDGFTGTQIVSEIIGILLDGEPDAGLLDTIQLTLENGLRIEPAVHCAPFLEAAAVFCQRCPDQRRVILMVEFIAKGVETINNSGGKEHLAFFTGLCDGTNERLGMESAFFTEIVLKTLPLWAPTLLIDKDRAVRGEVHNFINAMLLGDENSEVDTPGPERDEGQAGESETRNELRRNIGRALVDHCLGRLKKSFLNDQIRHIDRRQLENIMPVMNICLGAFYDESDADQDQVQQVESMFEQLDERLSLQNR
jgi:ubiquitin carboxyl-terminal hydrolase 34